MLSSRPRKAILVVEDDPRLRALYRTALTLDGYAVVTAGDGVDAIRHIDESVPALVVLDLGLPLMSGRDVGREIASRPSLARTPIVVVTGDPGVVDPHDYACVLRKPIDPDDLLDAVNRCLQRIR